MDAGVYPASQANSARLTASGRSIVDICPQSGTISSVAPAIPSAISRARSGGVGLYGVEGDLAGSQLQLDARPDGGGARVTLRTDEHYGKSSVVIRQIFRREPVFEYGVNLGMGMVLLRGVIAQARGASQAPAH